MTDAQKIKDLEDKVSLYEKPGAATLYYALNRKMNEIATLLNSVSLSDVNMASKADASFDRVFKLLEKSEGISTAAKSLGALAGVTGDEEKDTQGRPFIESVAQIRA